MNYYTESAASFWIPASEAGAGSISSEGNIVSGTNTFFTIQLESGDWIVDSSGNSAQVRTVVDDTTLEVYGTSNVSGSLEIVKGDNAKNLFLGVKNKAGADITIDGVTVVDGDSKVFGQQNSAGYRRKFVRPKFVANSSEGQILINIERNTNLRRMASVPFIPGLFDPDYQAVLDYATTQGYSLPSEGQQTLQNQLVLDLKSAGVWSKLDSFGVFATDGNSDYALIDWVRLSTMTAVNAPTFTTNQGYQGNGTSSYIDTLYNASIDSVNYIQESSSLSVYTYNTSSNGGYELGGLVTTPSTKLNQIATNRGGNIDAFSNTAVVGTRPSNGGNARGHFLATRNSLTTHSIYQNGTAVVLNESVASTSLANVNTYILCRNLNGAYNTGSNNTVSVFSIGGDLSAEAADFNTAIQTYISAI